MMSNLQHLFVQLMRELTIKFSIPKGARDGTCGLVGAQSHGCVQT